MDFIETFDHNFAPKLAGRASTFRSVVREALTVGATRFVETGCTRKENNWDGDGQSTLIWDALAAHKGGAFSTVDISKEATDLARKLCPNANVSTGDSVKFLQKYTGMIDVLYLDSYDLDASKPHDAALHAMFELTAAMRNLHKNSIVFVDDSPMHVGSHIGGKGLYVAQYFKQMGIYPFTTGYQAAWLMP